MQINSKFSQKTGLPVRLKIPSANIITQKSKRRIAVNIEFGKLNEEAECVGLGICRVSMLKNSYKPQKCTEANAYLILNRPEELAFRFLREELKACTRMRFFSTENFPILEDITLNFMLCKALDCKAITLKKGHYKVLRRGNTFEFRVQIE